MAAVSGSGGCLAQPLVWTFSVDAQTSHIGGAAAWTFLPVRVTLRPGAWLIQGNITNSNRLEPVCLWSVRVWVSLLAFLLSRPHLDVLLLSL